MEIFLQTQGFTMLSDSAHRLSTASIGLFGENVIILVLWQLKLDRRTDQQASRSATVYATYGGGHNATKR